jgi:putative ABC transport system permease protein
LYPSYYVTSFPPALALKGNFGLSPTGRRLRNGLISLQFFAAFVLIIGAAFMYLQNYYMQHAPVGYDRDELIVATTSPKMRNSNEAVTNQLKNFSGIADVTYGQFLLSTSDMYMSWGREYNDKAIQFHCIPVETNFLDVLGIKVGEGRGFREGDKQNKYGVYIFNETAKATYDMQLNSAIDSAEIIGFMPDVKFQTLRTAVEPMAFYVPGQQGWGYSQFVYIKVKAGADLRSAYEHVESTLKEFDSEYPFNVRFYDAILDAVYRQETNLGMLITIFSLIAVLISIVGVFGLVVFDSEYRRKEISLRKVFGSTSAEILMLFGKGYILILSICFVVASPIAWYAVSRWLENFAYRTPMYWWVYACAFIAVLMLTIATVTVQNWRAANANPIDSIKEN